MRRFLELGCVLLLIVGVSGCNNSQFTPPPTEAEFSVGAFSVPFPSDLFITLAGLTEGQLMAGGAPGAGITNTPIIPSATDPADTGDVLVAQGFLDGFSNTMPMQIDFTHNIDAASVRAGDTVRVFEIAILPPSSAFAATGTPLSLPAGPSIGAPGIIRELQADVDYSATLTKSVQYQIMVKPKVPWPASDNTSLGGLSRGILVMVTDGVQDFRGNAVIRSDQYSRMAQGIVENTGDVATDGLFNATAAAVQTSLGLLAAQAGVDPDSVIVSNYFSCQSVTDVLDAGVAATLASPAPVTTAGVGIPGFDNVHDFLLNAAGVDIGSNYSADLRQGTITLSTYYPGGSIDRASWYEAVTGYWQDGGVVYQSSAASPNPSFPTRYSPVAQVQGSFEVPVLVATPKVSDYPPPWPVVIFQHGITRSRFDCTAFTPLLCSSGFAVISMDAPLHGTVAPNPYFAGYATPDGIAGEERTFGIDLLDNATGLPTGFDENGLPIGDGLAEESGEYFLNFPSLISSRSVWMQAVCDLAKLTQTIPNWDFDGDPLTGDINGADFTDEIHYAGQSLGGLIGTTFLSALPEGMIKSAELNVAGGGVAKMLENSPVYNPRLMTFFEGEGLVQGTTRAEQALNVISAIADGIDPVVHIRRAAAKVPVHMGVIAGGRTPSPEMFGFDFPDTVVSTNSLGTGLYGAMVGVDISLLPNGDQGFYTGIAESSYLGGAFPMQRIGSLTLHSSLGLKDFPPSLHSGGATNYITGDHGSYADPTSGVGFAMQSSGLTWVMNEGKSRNVLVRNVYPPQDVIVGDADPIVDVMNGETRLGTITMTETGDPDNPLEAVFETIGDAGSLAAAATALGGHHFNWYQLVTTDALPSRAPSGAAGSVGSLLTSPRIDPPSGGTGQTSNFADNGVYADDKPWLWNEVQAGPSDFAEDQDDDAAVLHCVREYTNNSASPSPAGIDPCVGDPALQSSLGYDLGPWMGGLSAVGETFQVRVWLVLVDSNGDMVRLLNGFTFGQEVTTGVGGVGVKTMTTGIAEMPGSPGVTNFQGVPDDSHLSGF